MLSLLLIKLWNYAELIQEINILNVKPDMYEACKKIESKVTSYQRQNRNTKIPQVCPSSTDKIHLLTNLVLKQSHLKIALFSIVCVIEAPSMVASQRCN